MYTIYKTAVNTLVLTAPLYTSKAANIRQFYSAWRWRCAPDAVKLDVAPPGYQVIRQHRGTSTEKRGSVVTFVHADSVGVRPLDVGSTSSFEVLSVRLTTRPTVQTTVACGSAWEWWFHTFLECITMAVSGGGVLASIPTARRRVTSILRRVADLLDQLVTPRSSLWSVATSTARGPTAASSKPISLMSYSSTMRCSTSSMSRVVTCCAAYILYFSLNCVSCCELHGRF